MTANSEALLAEPAYLSTIQKETAEIAARSQRAQRSREALLEVCMRFWEMQQPADPVATCF